MMNTASSVAGVRTSEPMITAFDVGKDTLNYYSEYRDGDQIRIASGECENATRAIEDQLATLAYIAHRNGYRSLLVVCEPTGAYHFSLFDAATRAGHLCAYVSGEAVAKFKVIEHSDNGKTDLLDPRVIYRLASIGKTKVYRQLASEYRQLRELSRAYVGEKTRYTEIRCSVHHLLVRLFPDYPMGKDFFYAPGGQALLKQFGFNPPRIVEAGASRFESLMRAAAKGIHATTIARLWQAAESSARQLQDQQLQEIIELRLVNLAADYQVCTARVEHIQQLMVGIYSHLWYSGEPVPSPAHPPCSIFRLARIIGETGPLSDFANARVLLKYAGLNLRERQSGYYRGHTKLSKKGRSTLRAAVGEAVFRLVKRHEPFGPYYHRKKAEGMVGSKAMVAVQRKLLVTIYALGIKRAEFSSERLHQCQTQIVARAA
jgi:transposase